MMKNDILPTVSNEGITRRSYLKFAVMSAGAIGAIGAESDIVVASSGYGADGYGDGGYGGASDDSPLAVSTNSPTNVGETGVTLNGSLSDLGGAESAECSFEYRTRGTSSWEATAEQTLSTTGTFSTDVSGLSDGIEYEYRAVATTSDGDSDTGDIVPFTTTENTVTVSTGQATNIGVTDATLQGAIDEMGNASSVDCAFEYRQVGDSRWTQTDGTTLTSPGSFDATITGLVSGTDYEFRATALASDGDTDTGDTITFTTDGAQSAPMIEQFIVSEAGLPNPHANIEVNWDVWDIDGDLHRVEIDVTDPETGEVRALHTHAESGYSAGGTDDFKVKHVRDKTLAVTLTVVDRAGRETSETESVTE